MRTRENDAVFIQLGACNPTAIAHSFIRHAQAMRENDNADTNTICSDPALRLIAHQLAFLMGAFELDKTHDKYSELLTLVETADEQQRAQADRQAERDARAEWHQSRHDDIPRYLALQFADDEMAGEAYADCPDCEHVHGDGQRCANPANIDNSDLCGDHYDCGVSIGDLARDAKDPHDIRS